VRAEATFAVEHREKLLIRFHGRDQRLLRYPQEGLLETTGDRPWPFGQGVDLLQIVLADARVPAHRCGSGLDLGANAGAALDRINQHLGLTQGLDVIIGAADPHRLGEMKAMAAAHAISADAEHFAIDDLVAKQQYQPVQRPREGKVVIAPAHRLRDRHRRNRFAHDLRQQAGGIDSGDAGAMHETLTLGVADPAQRVPFDPGLGGEAAQCWRRLAVAVERDIQIRPQHFALPIGLTQRYRWQAHGEPARCVQRPCMAALVGNAALVQAGEHAVEQRLCQFR